MQLEKAANASSDASANLGLKDGMQPPSASREMLHAPVPSTTGGMSGMTAPTGAAAVQNYEAVKRAQELAARMGFRQDPEFAPVINLFPGQVATDVPPPQKPTKAPVLRLDALGREIDEHGNVVNVTKPNNLSTLKVCYYSTCQTVVSYNVDSHLVVSYNADFVYLNFWFFICFRSTLTNRRKTHSKFLNLKWIWILNQILILTRRWVLI